MLMIQAKEHMFPLFLYNDINELLNIDESFTWESKQWTMNLQEVGFDG